MSAGRPTRPEPLPQRAPAVALPPEITERLLGQVDRMADTLARHLAAEIQLPPGFRSQAYLRSVVQACRDGIGALVQQLHDQRRHHTAELARLGRAGERQAEMGVPLEVLLSAYRLAARVVWHEVIGEAGRVRELEPATVLAVSEQVLDYLDQISGAVGRAYLETRERLMRQRDRDRNQVLQRLLVGDVADEVRRLAASLSLDLAPPYRVLACGAPQGIDAEPILDSAWRFAGALLVGDEPGTWIALVRADADVTRLARAGTDAMLRALGAGHSGGADVPLRAGVGPVAARLEDIAGAARRARRALAVGSRLHPDAVIHDEREVGVFAALGSDPEELRAHVDHVLGPILNGSRSRSAMLLETLEALVTSRGVNEAATQLGIHRHTVVYRVQRLHDLLGVDLDDPAQRHRLWLALQSARLLQ